MRAHLPLLGFFLSLLISWPTLGQSPADASARLPAGVWPVIGCWFWGDAEFEPEGYKSFLDLAAAHTSYNLLTTSLRADKGELTDVKVHDQILAAARYARQRGMGVVMDLDVRLARSAFRRQYPSELQEMLRLRETSLDAAGTARLSIASERLADHYTYRMKPYLAVSGRLVRVYSYVRGAAGIEPETLHDITASCQVEEASEKQVRVAIPCAAQTAGRRACVMAAFTHLTPDVFAPHLLSFQREILRQYADAGLAGACKDEWGFPPCFDGCPAKNDYWYSQAFAAAYAEGVGRRDLVADCLLMHAGFHGREAERQAAINRFMELCWRQNGAVEDDFYQAVKTLLGPTAMVATHPTWYPYPGTREFKKNGLDWWIATRDIAQTDEVTPFCVRTALAKKWGSPLWYNMFYARDVAAYEKAVWTHALGGGRVNFHPLFPTKSPPGWSLAPLLSGGLTRGDCRVRLLNFIMRSPLDCPVAVVFGHACAMNWAGPAYDDVGIALCNRLWAAGYPADLIPTSEISRKSLVCDDRGGLRYGAQRYAAAVLYHPQFERPDTARLFRDAARGPTALWCLGDWTADFGGQPFDGKAALPERIFRPREIDSCAAAVIAELERRGVRRQVFHVEPLKGFSRESAAPSTEGRCRLLDGTELIVAGSRDPAGDPIIAALEIKGQKVEIEAQGVAAIRLGQNGQVEALAAGGLRRCVAGKFHLILDRPVDMALWRDEQGTIRGVLQDCDGAVPVVLAAITPHWNRLAIPRSRQPDYSTKGEP